MTDGQKSANVDWHLDLLPWVEMNQWTTPDEPQHELADKLLEAPMPCAAHRIYHLIIATSLACGGTFIGRSQDDIVAARNDWLAATDAWRQRPFSMVPGYEAALPAPACQLAPASYPTEAPRALPVRTRRR